MKGRILYKIIIFFMVCEGISALEGAITGDVAQTIKRSAWFCAMGLYLAYLRIENEG